MQKNGKETDLILYMMLSLKVLGFGQNAFGVNTMKNPQGFSESWKESGYQNQIRNIIFDKKEIDEIAEILNKIKSFSETLFKSQSSKNENGIEKFLCVITAASLNPI